jgi:hypothetical protein
VSAALLPQSCRSATLAYQLAVMLPALYTLFRVLATRREWKSLSAPGKIFSSFHAWTKERGYVHKNVSIKWSQNDGSITEFHATSDAAEFSENDLAQLKDSILGSFYSAFPTTTDQEYWRNHSILARINVQKGELEYTCSLLPVKN